MSGSLGGSAANYIAKWDGSSWSALGSGMDGSVVALAVSGGDLYAGGNFMKAGGVAANRIAKWNGSSWSALGSGMWGGLYNDTYVTALAVSGSDLYAGGLFKTAGGKVSVAVARAIIDPPALAIEPDGGGGYFLRFSAVPDSDYRLQRAPGLSGLGGPAARRPPPRPVSSNSGTCSRRPAKLSTAPWGRENKGFEQEITEEWNENCNIETSREPTAAGGR